VFASLAQKRIDALLVSASAIYAGMRVQIATAAARHGIPTMTGGREMADAGALASYGSDPVDNWRQVGIYAGRILKGEKPTDLPVLRPTKFNFVINLPTARLLGVTIPPTLLALADTVIE
jgi:putative tryptophan/tyrosine transport system substrate-binding protein